MRYEIELPDGSLFILYPFNQTYNTLQYQSWFDDKEVTQYNSHGVFPHSKKSTEQFLKDIELGKILVWAITVCKIGHKDYEHTTPPKHKHGIHIGNVSLQSINWINRSAELAIFIGEKDFHNKGIGKVACNVTLNHAFNVLNMSRVWTGTAATNIGMQKICLSLGLKREGTFKQGVFLNGRYEDVYYYGILRDEI